MTVVRAGYGIFYARFPGSLINNLFSNNGVTQQSITLQSTNPAQQAAGPSYWSTLPSVPASATVGASNIQFAAPNLRTPYSQQANVAVERKLRGGGIFTASYLWSRGLQLLTSRDPEHWRAGTRS